MAFGRELRWIVGAGLLLLYASVAAQPFSVEKIVVGAIFDQNTEEIQNVFKYAMNTHNQNISSRRLELQAYVDVINTADAFKLSRLICNQFARGVFAMLGAVTPESFDTLHSYTNTFQMPFVTPWFPEKVIPPSSGLIDHAVSMRPDYHKAIVDTIVWYGWKEIIYMYDSHDGLLRLQQLYQSMQPGRTAFRISLVKRITNASEAMDFLLALEQHDRWGNKRIVLDCNAKNAKSILVEHVRKVQLGRRTYHYMLSGLVMDDHWENEVTEYGAVNITGFRIVDHSRKIVRDFMDGLRRMDPRFKGTISAQAALMYDGVQVLMDALGRLSRKKPDAFRNALRRAAGQANSTKVIDCNPGKSWVVPFEHGDKISRLIKKTDIEGLTGNISFNEEGHRYNFTLQVVEMTVQSAMLTVGTWTDGNGLSVTSPKQVQLKSPATYETNKTYTVTTILQEPYMMLKSKTNHASLDDQYHGFCKDLMDLIAQKLGIKYELKLVKDGTYGSESSPSSWSGLVGEIVRKEADIAVAPLAVTPDRELVVDFSEAFLSINYPISHAKTPKQLADTFSFLRPLSKEIWLCVVFSFFAVSIVLFLVSRFSPHEWRSVSITDTHLDHPISSANEIILHNEFSIWNSFWFSLGSFMQQGSDVVPKSLSGRIVGTVWWFFALILVCSYTANLAAYLIVERLSEPSRSIVSPSMPQTEHPHIQQSGIEGQFLNEDLAQYTMEKEGQLACGSMPRVCSYKHVNFAIAVPKGSPLREGINLAIVDLKANGVISKLWRKWVLATKKSDCDEVKDEETSITEMTLGQVAGIFYVLVGGLALALGVALLEFCQHGRAEAARANVSLRAALTAKARLASRAEHKPPHAHSHTHGGRQRDHERLGWNGAAFTGAARKILKYKEHKTNCVLNDNRLVAKKIVSMCVEEAVSSEDTVPAVYKKVVSSFEDASTEFVTKIPSFQQMSSTVYRRINEHFKVNATTSRDALTLELSPAYSDFLLADCIYEDNRIVLFASKEARKHLKDVKTCMLDGTFDVCPAGFAQLYTLHGDLGSSNDLTNVIPLVYALLTNKTKETYIKMLELIKSKIPAWQPTEILTDFEAAAIAAIREVFPGTEHHGCHFHFSQALWKKAKKLKIIDDVHEKNCGYVQCFGNVTGK